MLHKISQGHCPAYFNNYIECICNTHTYNTRSVSNSNITAPACKKNSGLRTFHSSACLLWNTLDAKLRLFSHTNLKKKYLFKLYRSRSSSRISKDFVKHLTIKFCDLCDSNYVGYTTRHLFQRVADHRYSSIGRHLRDAHGNIDLLNESQFRTLKKCSTK